MKKRGEFGAVLPRLSDIVKIDGNKVVDRDGDEHNTGSIRMLNALGGEWQRVDGSMFGRQPRRPKKENP